MSMDLQNTDLDEIDPATLEAVIETDKGTMHVEFFPDKAPKTVHNFIKLAAAGFYDGLTFHRIIKGFMVQTGCPKGNGTGGPGWTLEAEFNDVEHRRGVLSMARTRDPNSAGSQFYIVHGEHAAHLDGQYTAFGRITSGLDVLDALASVPVDSSGPSGEASRPVERVCMQNVTLNVRTTEQQPASEGEQESETHE